MDWELENGNSGDIPRVQIDAGAKGRDCSRGAKGVMVHIAHSICRIRVYAVCQASENRDGPEANRMNE